MRLPKEEMKVILDAAWDQYYSYEETDPGDSYYFIIRDALEECGWTEEEYYEES